MGIVWGVSFLGITAVGNRFDGRTAALALALPVAAFALGECLHGAIYAPLVADLAEPRLIGRFMAFSSFSWQVGFLAGPAAGGFVLQHAPLTLWLGAAAVCVVASAYALALERHLPLAVRMTPRDVGSAAGLPGTMAKMAPTTEDPVSTRAEPAPHPADTAAAGGGRAAPARGAHR
jgi:MFS family permease